MTDAQADLTLRIVLNMDRIFVRAYDPTMGWGSYALVELPPIEALRHVGRFVEEGRMPAMVAAPALVTTP